MKIAIIGATGMAGLRLVHEALKRGHHVTGIARHTDKLPQHDNLKALELDVEDVASMAEAIRGHDVVLLALKYSIADGNKAFEAIRKAGIKRVAVVGGAGSLEVSPGVFFVDTEAMPAVAVPQSKANAKILDMLKETTDLEWIYISPSAYFFDGDARGNIRYGKDQLLVDKDGKSSISTGDYAVVMLDEIENPKHIRERFTVGY